MRDAADYRWTILQRQINESDCEQIEWHPGALFQHVAFIVTNRPMDPASGWCAADNQRGTAEQYIKEGKDAFHWARQLSGLIRPVPVACATADAAWGKKRLSNWQIQAIFAAAYTQLGKRCIK